jgi:hypothetical protein
LAPYLQQAGTGLRWVTAALAWTVGLLLAQLWPTFALRQFARTRPWGELSTTWPVELAGGFVSAIAGTLPGLAVAVLIFVLARLATRAQRASFRAGGTRRNPPGLAGQRYRHAHAPAGQSGDLAVRAGHGLSLPARG